MSATWMRSIASLAIAALCALVIASEFPRVVSDHGLWDFGSFVASGRAAREGLNPYGIYPLTLHVVLPGFESYNPNLNPPISALLFQLFDIADPALSLRVWWWISVACYLATIILLLRRYAGSSLQALVMGLFALALAGFWDTLFLGQIYLPLVLAGAGAWLLLERGADLRAGLLIGLVIAIKPNFLVWPALLFLSGRRRPALTAVGVAGLISAIPLAAFGVEVYRQWFELIASDRERAFFLTNGSFAGLAARAGAPALGPVLSLALLAGLAWWAFRHRPSLQSAGSFGLLASLLASPLGWIHYTLFLLPVFFAHWSRPAIRTAGLLLVIPVPFIIDQFTKPAWVQLTIGSVYGWALVLCLVALVAAEWGARQTTPGRRGAAAEPIVPSGLRGSLDRPGL